MKNITNLKIKKGDNVLVNTGKDAGKHGVIESVFVKNGKIIVTGVNRVKKHLKPSRKNPQGGIIDKLAPIDSSNVALICPRCNKATRVGYKIIKNDKKDSKDIKKKIRICKKCNESVDQNA